MTFLVLGAGMQGKAVLHDLVQSGCVDRIIAADKDIDSLKAFVSSGGYHSGVECIQVDAGDIKSLELLISQKPDVIIDVLPSAYMNSVATLAVKYGAHLVNTFYTSDIIKNLHGDAEKKSVTILPEFGLDPGIDLVLFGEAIRFLDTIDTIDSYGAGIPEPSAANNPLQYKITWTFDGVLNAYTRTSNVIKHGRVVEINGHEIFHPHNIHTINIEGLGALEAFPNGNAAGYLDLLGEKKTGLQNMGRYTLRYPGHCEFWKKLVDLHLLDDDPVSIDGVSVNRKRFLAEALKPYIRLNDNERDIALVRIEATGTKDIKKTKAVYQVLDRRDLKTGFYAMSRTVGFTASIGALMLGKGIIKKRGVLSPVHDIPYEPFKQELKKRGIEITTQVAGIA